MTDTCGYTWPGNCPLSGHGHRCDAPTSPAWLLPYGHGHWCRCDSRPTDGQTISDAMEVAT